MLRLTQELSAAWKIKSAEEGESERGPRGWRQGNKRLGGLERGVFAWTQASVGLAPKRGGQSLGKGRVQPEPLSSPFCVFSEDGQI